MWPAAKAFFDHLAALGGAIALREGDRQLSYAKLLAEVAQRSNQLQALGARRIALATQVAGVIQGKLQLPNKAFSYLSSHGSLDIEHIEFFKN